VRAALLPVTHAATMSAASGMRVDMLMPGFIIVGYIASLIAGHTAYMEISLEPNKKLDNFVYSSKRAVSQLECVEHCSQDGRCMSFNFNKNSGNGGLCELNNGTKENSSLTDATGYTYGEDKSATKYRQVRKYHIILKEVVILDIVRFRSSMWKFHSEMSNNFPDLLQGTRSLTSVNCHYCCNITILT
jgi:hypothetical protein